MPPKGKGRPPFYGARMRRIQVMLDDDTVQAAQAIGELRTGKANLSAGIRTAVALAIAALVDSGELVEEAPDAETHANNNGA